VVSQHARRSHRARGSGFTDLRLKRCDLHERQGGAAFGHALDMILLKQRRCQRAHATCFGRTTSLEP
jgi:hypothetical protein